MRMRKAVILSLILLLSVFSFSQRSHSHKKSSGGSSGVDVSLPPAAQAALKSVDAEKIRQHVRFLSHDLLEGRGTGQRGGDIAAEYIATQFALYGLKPAGDNHSYIQKVPLVGVTPQPEQSNFVLEPAKGAPMPLKFLDDYVVYNQHLTERTQVDADIVFVGYGIEAPEYNWNDYKDVDVRGKVLLMLVNEPSSDDPKFFTGKALTYYGRWTYKYEEAARKGAVGAILIHKTDMASYPWEVVRNSNSGEKSYLKTNDPRLDAAAWIQLEVARKLVADNGMDLDQLMKQAQSRDFRPVPINAKLKATIVSKVRPIQSQNVIAMLPGSDQRLKNEAVMFTAHYDHLGIRPDQPGDNIYNGADDNATGCGILLEMARAMAEAKQHPKRSVIFASVTAEEQGLLGSEYLGKHPPIPAGKIALDLNYDDLPPIGVPEETEVVGSERTSFYPTVEATAKAFGLAIKPDSNPTAGYYYRSDHFSMARVGVPAFSVSEGMKFQGHTPEWGHQQADDYTAHRYHQPSDEYKPEMVFTGDAKMAEFGIALGWKAANAPAMPKWNPGDEFEAARKKSETGD
jgi:Zn-dependent M28 family amino/carboxypeptidase